MSLKERMELSDRDLERLVHLELPYNRVDELKAAEGVTKLTHTILGVLVLVSMLVLFLPAVFVFSPWFAKLLLKFGYFPDDVLMVELNFVSGVFLIFGGIFGAAWFLASVTRLFPKFNRRVMLTSIREMVNPAQKYRWANEWILKRVIQRTVKRAGTEGDFLKYYTRVCMNIYTLGVLLCYAVAGTFVYLDVRAVTWVTPEGISLCSYFEGKREFLAWDQAEKITTGCNWKSEDRDIYYEVYFSEEVDRNLAAPNYQTFGMEQFDVIYLIDQTLRQGQVPWERDSLGYGKLVRDCYEVNRRRLSAEDQKRFNEIYRTGDAAPEGE